MRTGPDSALDKYRPALLASLFSTGPTTDLNYMCTDRVLTSTLVSGPRPVRSDRRRRTRLRALCDEVLASFRLASDSDPISEQDRQAAMELLPRVAPIARA